MGYQRAAGMAEAVDDGLIELNIAIGYHLAANHFPPVSRELVPVCAEAIEIANQDGPWDAELKLPNGKTLPVGAIIEGLHLQAFIEEVDDE
jgi:hypothetical protein